MIIARRPAGMRNNHPLIIDGTLIDSTDIPTGWAMADIQHDHLERSGLMERGQAIKKRPGLDAFLDAAFASGTVALWTHAPARWADLMVNRVLLAADGSVRPWAFVWCSQQAVRRGTANGADGGCHTGGAFALKPLRKVWRTKHLRSLGFTRGRTLIVEDTAENCTENFGNAIYVPSYSATATGASDSILPRLTAFLEYLAVSAPLNVRATEKRGWEANTYSDATPCGSAPLLPPSTLPLPAPPPTSERSENTIECGERKSSGRVTFSRHDEVTIQLLMSRPELNGQRATVLGWDEASERYKIKVAAGGASIKLKPECLLPHIIEELED